MQWQSLTVLHLEGCLCTFRYARNRKETQTSFVPKEFVVKSFRNLIKYWQEITYDQNKLKPGSPLSLFLFPVPVNPFSCCHHFPESEYCRGSLSTCFCVLYSGIGPPNVAQLSTNGAASCNQESRLSSAWLGGEVPSKSKGSRKRGHSTQIVGQRDYVHDDGGQANSQKMGPVSGEAK